MTGILIPIGSLGCLKEVKNGHDTWKALISKEAFSLFSVIYDIGTYSVIYDIGIVSMSMCVPTTYVFSMKSFSP